MIDNKEILKQKLIGIVFGTAIGVPLAIYFIDPAIDPLNNQKLLAQYIAAVLGIATVLVTSDMWISKILNVFNNEGDEESTDNSKSSSVKLTD
jgi:hypothetical protein